MVAGDTLSGISREVLKDGKLWPQIWEQNEHVVNPHWIYPNDKVLIRPVTRISEAKPPEPDAPAAAAAPEPAPEATPEVKPQGPQPLKRASCSRRPIRLFRNPALHGLSLNLNPPRVFPEVKEADLNCAGFIRAEDVARDVKVLGRYSDGKTLATDNDYLYIGQGLEGGIKPGAIYEVLRPTRSIDGLGMHYLEVAQVQIMLGQADHALGRITHGCEAVEIGDVLVPFNKTEFPALPAKRPFSGAMKTSGQIPGNVILTKDSVLNSGSAFGTDPRVPNPGGSLRSLDRGVVGEGSVVYLDIGKQAGAKPGDLFIVFRDSKVVKTARVAIAEVVILKVEDARLLRS